MGIVVLGFVFGGRGGGGGGGGWHNMAILVRST